MPGIQVAAITVRQALALLSNDGLIVSRRGSGTYVTDAPSTGFPKQQTTSEDLHTPLPATRIRVLRRERSVALPPELSSDKDDVSYAHLMKVHDSGTTPFVIMNVYVTSRAYDRFPKGADETTRLSELFREHSGIPIAHDRQLFTISYADRNAAQHLKCSLGSVLMQMRSWWFDESGKVAFAGNFLYRGDMFILERGGIHPTHGLLPTVQAPLPKSGKDATRPAGRPKSKARRQSG